MELMSFIALIFLWVNTGDRAMYADATQTSGAIPTEYFILLVFALILLGLSIFCINKLSVDKKLAWILYAIIASIAVLFCAAQALTYT